MDSAASLTGDNAVMHDAHSAVEYGPIYGPFIVFGAYKTFASGATKAWHRLRGR